VTNVPFWSNPSKNDAPTAPFFIKNGIGVGVNVGVKVRVGVNVRVGVAVESVIKNSRTKSVAAA
jgi:hypothetical protein